MHKDFTSIFSFSFFENVISVMDVFVHLCDVASIFGLQ
jgi:hypothetical protein